jgi:hypothetical protein
VVLVLRGQSTSRLTSLLLNLIHSESVYAETNRANVVAFRSCIGDRLRQEAGDENDSTSTTTAAVSADRDDLGKTRLPKGTR